MKVSHRQLEECRRRPRQWIASQLSPSTARSFGYAQALLLAIHRFHNDGPAAARQHLNNLIDLHLTNETRIEEIQDDLESYMHWINRTGTIIADSKIRIALDIGGFLTLSGEVSRLDVTADGYQAVILGEKPPGWKQHLRLPLVQRAMSIRYGRPTHEIAVAMQDLDGSDLEALSFDEAEIGRAESEFRTLGDSVRHLLPNP